MQLVFGVIFALFWQGSAIIGVLIFALVQAVFTKCIFAKSGAKNRHAILKMLVVGEVAKILLFVVLVIIASKVITINYFEFIIGIAWMQLLALLLPYWLD